MAWCCGSINQGILSWEDQQENHPSMFCKVSSSTWLTLDHSHVLLAFPHILFSSNSFSAIMFILYLVSLTGALPGVFSCSRRVMVVEIGGAKGSIGLNVDHNVFRSVGRTWRSMFSFVHCRAWQLLECDMRYSVLVKVNLDNQTRWIF